MTKRHDKTLAKYMLITIALCVAFPACLLGFAAITHASADEPAPMIVPGAGEIVEFDHDGMHYTILNGTSASHFILLRTETTEEYRARQAVKKQD